MPDRHRGRSGTVFVVEQALEDERGVDRGAIRERLRLSAAERVQRLVEEVEVWSAIRGAAGVPTRDDV